MNYYHLDPGYAAVSNRCPKGFKGVLFIGQSGTTPATVAETVFPVDDLRRMQQVDRLDVPSEWLAFGEQPHPEPEPKPVPEPAEVIVLDEQAENLVAIIPVEWPTYAPAAERLPTMYQVGLLIGLALAVIIFCCF
jgi:hypothetical protein